MTYRRDASVGAGYRLRGRLSSKLLGQTAAAGLCAAAWLAGGGAAVAASNIDAGSTYLASNLGGSVNPDFNGGTLELDSSTTITKNFTVENVATNTIDIFGSTVTMSGAFTGAGPLTIADSKGGGNLTLTSSGNTYTGTTTINSGALLSLSGSGTIATSAGLIDNGTFDISATTSGASIISLGGSGTVSLGAEILALSNAADTFSGAIGGPGAVTLTAGSETFSGVNLYTGLTTITAGTLALSGNGSIAASSGVFVTGTFDISATSGASIKSLNGTGRVVLGDQSLTLTSASGVFSGIISGNGGLVLESGTQYLTGANTFSGPVTIENGTLDVGSDTIAYNVANSGTFAFSGTGTTTMSGVISGSGAVAVVGGGIAAITTPQTYTGPTSIVNGRLTLSGDGSIAASSSLTVGGVLDITQSSGASITSLSGTGIIYLGSETLTLTNASGTYSGTFSGTGNVTLAGGSETLSGASTYSGTTTVSSGTLVLPSGSSLKYSTVVDNGMVDISSVSPLTTSTSISIASLSGAGTVTLGGNTLVLVAANDTFSGTISGGGGLTISSGTEVLSGANTYTGTTTISAGTLALSSTGSLAAAGNAVVYGRLDLSAASGPSIGLASLSGTGTVDLGANGLNLTGASGTFSGTIRGTGGLTVSGGTEVLAGTNSYTGGTVVSAGTLQIGNNSSAGSIVGDIADNGTLAFGGTGSAVFANVISGSGGVVQSGPGTTILTADESYTGGTTIKVGTLQIGNDGTGGSITGDVTDNGTLAFGRSDSTTFGGTISGTGGITIVRGTAVLTAVNSYTGVTAIDSGANLVLGSGGSVAASRDVADDGTFDVSAATAPQIGSLDGSGSVTLGSQSLTLTGASGTFAGAISGTGGVTIAAGTETFAGTNGYTGITTINGGTLAVSGSIAGSQGVTVNAGGTLAGTGSVSTVTVNSGGTLAPGMAGAGALTAGGPVTFADGADFAVNASSASVTSFTTSGSATLAGTLSVASTDGTYALGRKLTVLTADGGVTGSFTLAQVENTGAEFSSALSYDAQNVYLEIDLAKLSPLLPSGAPANEVQPVAGIDAAIAAGDTLPSQFENLGNVSSAQLAADAMQMSGEIGSAVPAAGKSLYGPFLDAVFDHISEGRLDDPAVGIKPLQQQGEAWVTGFGGTSLVAGDPGAVGSHELRSDMSGVVAGANWVLGPNVMLGAAVSAGHSNFRLVDGNGTGKVDALQGAIYGFARLSPHFYTAFAGAFSRSDITTDRVLTVSGTDALKGKLNATVYGARVEWGVSLGWMTPYVAGQDALLSLPAYSETMASGADTFALHYASRTVNAASVEAGFRHSTDVDFTPRWVLTPDGTLRLTARAAWVHDFSGGSQADAAFVALPSSDFTVTSAKADRDAVLVSLGAQLRFDGGFRVGARLETNISPNSQSYLGFLGATYTW